MKHFAIEAKHQGLRVPLPVLGMERLLMDRKAGLEAQIRQRFADARANRFPKPSVSLLSATLRAVKRQIVIASGGR